MVVKFGALFVIEVNMKIGDTVELIDENEYEGNYRGRMKVVNLKGLSVLCDHPFYDELLWVLEDELVVMEECND